MEKKAITFDELKDLLHENIENRTKDIASTAKHDAHCYGVVYEQLVTNTINVVKEQLKNCLNNLTEEQTHYNPSNTLPAMRTMIKHLKNIINWFVFNVGTFCIEPTDPNYHPHCVFFIMFGTQFNFYLTGVEHGWRMAQMTVIDNGEAKYINFSIEPIIPEALGDLESMKGIETAFKLFQNNLSNDLRELAIPQEIKDLFKRSLIITNGLNQKN